MLRSKRLRALVPAVAVTAAASIFALGSGDTAALAAETYTVGSMHYTSRVFGSTGISGQWEATALIDLKDANGAVIGQTYCIDLHTPTETGIGGYQEKDWAGSGIKNLPQVQWILNNSFPTLDATKIAAAAGVTSLSNTEATAATQAAIWHFTDNFTLSPTANNADVVAVYDYLVKNAATTAPEPQTAVSVPTDSFKSGDKVGPITVTTSDGSDAKLTLTGTAVELFYADGTKVDLNAVKSGQAMYFTAPEGSGTVSFLATGTFNLPSGRVFVSRGHQTLIVAKPGDTVTTATGAVAWASAPVTSTVTTTVPVTTTVTETVTNPTVTETVTGPTTTETVTGTATVTETVTVPGPTSTETVTGPTTTETTTVTETVTNPTVTETITGPTTTETVTGTPTVTETITVPGPTGTETTTVTETVTNPNVTETVTGPATTQTVTGTATVTETVTIPGIGWTSGSPTASTTGPDSTTTSDSSSASDTTTTPADTTTDTGTRPPLAQTGANILAAGLGALALIAAGVCFILARRKKANG